MIPPMEDRHGGRVVQGANQYIVQIIVAIVRVS
jgi:hypothetical protein